MIISTKKQIQVRYNEVDSMKIAHHSKYIIWFEVGRIHLMDVIGVPYRELELNSIFMPVISMNCTYKNPAFFHDKLTIKSFIRSKPFLRINVEYEILRDEKILAFGGTEHVFVNANNKVIRIPKLFNEAINKI